MKILFVQESDWLSRGPHQQHQLADRLSLRGHEIVVIDYEILWRTQGKKELFSRRQVFSNVSKIDDRAKVTVVRPGIIKIPGLNYVSLIFTHRREIERQIAEFSPDVIVGYGILNAFLALRAAKKNAIPFIYYWIDVLHRLVPVKFLQPIARSMEREALKQADRVLVINEKLREYVIGAAAPPERTQVVAAGIDLKQFRPLDQTDKIREQYGLKKEDTVLFFMGWLYHFSGLKEVARELAREKYRNIKLLVVGEGDAYQELAKIQRELNLQEKLLLTGKRPYHDMPAFIAAADVCLMPAYPNERIMQDIVPIKMYEYMAMGKPVIATTLPGVMKEFGNDNGVVYVNKPEDAVEKAASLIRDGNVAELGVKARNFVARYDWNSITDEFEKILQEVINGRVPSRIPG